MKRLLPILFAVMLCACNPQHIGVVHSGDNLTKIIVSNPKGEYMLLPVNEDLDEMQVMLYTGSKEDCWMDVRLATDPKKVDYYVPFHIGTPAEAQVWIRHEAGSVPLVQEISIAKSFDTKNREKYRPGYHHTPLYGWMNDANGLIWKDGEYHLYYQYNPYGSKWGNMHWGHSVSRDLVNWEHLQPALERDNMGHIFSGSCVLDSKGSAGFGKDAIIAFYTSASDKQVTCLAYSTDNGRSFTKYSGNPVLTPADGIKDFRDPKVFYYAPEDKWVMIMSADTQMRFFESKNLKEWTYMSAWGDGFGAKPNQFECPDMMQLTTADGESRWVLIVNINPGCAWGGSATEYFTGTFDGHSFVCDNDMDSVKWMDYGKDHYATVCFSNTGNRTIAVPWMSNWQYANLLPTQQFRSANALPRELQLFKAADGDFYVGAMAVKEAAGLCTYDLDIECHGNDQEIVLQNKEGEKVVITISPKEGIISMDRRASGRYAREIPGFDSVTSAPLFLCKDGKGEKLNIKLFVDTSSIEMFVDDGRIAMTNLVFGQSEFRL